MAYRLIVYIALLYIIYKCNVIYIYTYMCTHTYTYICLYFVSKISSTQKFSVYTRKLREVNLVSSVWGSGWEPGKKEAGPRAGSPSGSDPWAEDCWQPQRVPKTFNCLFSSFCHCVLTPPPNLSLTALLLQTSPEKQIPQSGCMSGLGCVR